MRVLTTKNKKRWSVIEKNRGTSLCLKSRGLLDLASFDLKKASKNYIYIFLVDHRGRWIRISLLPRILTSCSDAKMIVSVYRSNSSEGNKGVSLLLSNKKRWFVTENWLCSLTVFVYSNGCS